MKKANKAELQKALSKALIMLATIHSDEYELCKNNCVRDCTIESKEDLQEFEDYWYQYSNHCETLEEVPDFIKEWKTK